MKDAPRHSGTVAVAGRPNAGKSTLLNALVGQKIAIVSDKPQTTRKRVLGIYTAEGGQIVFVDTPGIHRPLYRLNRIMVDEAIEAVREVDLRLLVIDASVPSGKGDEFVLDLFGKMPKPRIAVLNKVDLIEKNLLLPRLAALSERKIFDELVPISALTQENLALLRDLLFKYLPEGDELYPAGTLTTSPEVARAAEIIREKFLHRTREEIPYGLGVVIEEMAPRPGKDITVIRAEVVVDRESHKKIVLGRGGRLIKECGVEARTELEATFGRRFYLELVVTARPGWREDPRFLSQLTS